METCLQISCGPGCPSQPLQVADKWLEASEPAVLVPTCPEGCKEVNTTLSNCLTKMDGEWAVKVGRVTAHTEFKTVAVGFG